MTDISSLDNTSATLTADQESLFTQIIDRILANSDLHTVSAKIIRRGLQDELNYDISQYKAAVTKLIMNRFDIVSEHLFNSTTPFDPPSHPDSTSTTHPASRRHVNEDLSASSSPRKRKLKRESEGRSSSMIEDDAAFAARLQAEEDRKAGRVTRGVGVKTRRSANGTGSSSRNKKIRSVSKIISSDDDDGVVQTKREIKRTGGFHKPMVLSKSLANLLGESTLSRPQTVKKLWAYIHENKLQDQSDKRQIRCDEAMRAVFKQDRVHMFTMIKLLNQNLYSPDDE